MAQIQQGRRRNSGVDARLRKLERRWLETGDPEVLEQLVLAIVRSGKRLVGQSEVLMATELAEKAGRGKRKDLKLQAALDYALFRAGFLQLHISKRRLKSVVTRHWGSPAAAIEWLRDHNHYARMERFYLEAAVAMAQLLEHEELLQRAVTANIEDGWSPEEAPGYVMRWPSVALDRTRIGTPFYSGRAFFWNWAYRHNLRSMSTARGGLHSPATRVRRKKVHDAWLAAGLELDQESPEHQRIMRKILEHF